ncbi:zinc-ribbon domain-containing protein [uncultured Clostridium sp.]|uniref:zinc-ribbon domain-containing protein n=1 Tax=uncultured Clostridium sp. TaxID=59620 RepID=UPI00258AA1B5|nr:zinc-ribbon domain-containing protein [uncultured Clostridium sp.]
MVRKICKTNEEFWDELSKVWDYEKNEKHWLDFTKGSEQKIWGKCNEKDYHGSYYIRCNNFSNGKRCSYCAKKVKLHPKDSFGGVYEDMLKEIWDYEKIKLIHIL